MIALLSVLCGAVALEMGTVGEVPAATQDEVRAEVGRALAELTTTATISDTLSLTLVSGALSIRCVAVRRSTGATMELDLAGTLRPEIDELVLRLFPERVKRRIEAPAAVAVIETPLDPAPYIALGASAALLISGIIVGVHGSSAIGALQHEPMGADDYQSTLARARTESWVANGLYLSAALGAVITVALFFR